jgi:hypothetical protein
MRSLGVQQEDVGGIDPELGRDLIQQRTEGVAKAEAGGDGRVDPAQGGEPVQAAFQLRVQAPDLLLRSLPLGDVVHHHDGPQLRTVGIEEGLPARQDGPGSPALRRDDDLGVSDGLPLPRPVEGDLLHRHRRGPVGPVQAVMPGPRFGRERLDGPPVELLGDAIREDQDPLGVAGHDPVAEVLEESPQELPLLDEGRFRPLPLRDLGHQGVVGPGQFDGPFLDPGLQLVVRPEQSPFGTNPPGDVAGDRGKELDLAARIFMGEDDLRDGDLTSVASEQRELAGPHPLTDGGREALRPEDFVSPEGGGGRGR